MKSIWLGFLLGLVAVTGRAREVHISILHTADVTGHVLPVTSVSGGTATGGLLCAASLIDHVRRGVPNVMLVGCGTMVVGSLESRVTRGAMVIEAARAMEYDAWVPGRHDWDWGNEAFHRITELPGPTILGANIRSRSGGPERWKAIKPFMIREIDGVRVAVIGLTSPAVPLWHRPQVLGDLQFASSVEALKRVMPLVRQEQPDVVVLITSQGLLPFDDAGNQVREIARLFPEIDVILGGQTGQVIRERMLGNVLYAQAGYQAGHVGRVDIMYDTVTGRILRKTGGKYPVDEHQPMSADIRKHVQKHIGLVEAQSQKPLGILKGRLSGRRKGPGQTPLQRLICRAIQEQTDTQVAFYVMLGNPILHSGTLTYSDLWRMVPFDSRIGTMHVTIGELKAMLEENANDLKSRDFLGVYGLQYALDPRGARDEHVSNIRLLNGVHPHPRQRITVAAPGMLLASNGGRFRKLREIAERPASRLRMTDATVREAVRRYITRHTPIMAGDYHARDAKK